MAKNKQSTMMPLRTLLILMTIGFLSINECLASPLASKVCKTAGCMESAQLVLKNMDASINPCDNFYRFACGKFIEETVIPDDKSSVSLFSKKTDVLQDKLKQSFEGQLQKDDPKIFQLLQSVYNVCLDTEKIEKSSHEEVKEMLSSLGNWPVLVGQSWSESNFDWKDLTYKLRKLGYTNTVKSIVKFEIEIDEKNTKRYIITLDQAATAIDQEYLSRGSEEKVVKAYYKYMVELAKVLGADAKQAQKELAESLQFEVDLAKISLATEERRNMTALYNVRTLKQLQSEYSYIPWNEYLNQLLSAQWRVGPEDELIVKVPSFFESLSKLLSRTPKRVVANYLFWRVIEDSADYMNDEVRRIKAEFSGSLTGTGVQQPRWVQCISYASNSLALATGALYVRKNFDKQSKSQVQLLVKNVRESFQRMLQKVDWMDEETAKAAQVKLDWIETHVAYPDELFDNDKLDAHFQQLQVHADSYLKTHLSVNLFNLQYKVQALEKPVNRSNWIDHGITAIVNAFYEPAENSVQIPAGILQAEFFTSTRPAYMNYGAIAWIIGHEFTHGFDDQGSQYDRDGNLADWWQLDTKEEYLKRAQCIVDQYSNYTVTEVGLNINGKNTQGENIADNGGIKEAYLAYQQFEADNGQEPRLPGLSYSPRQMFWISAANLWCNKFRPEALKNRVITDVHSPGEFRIIGSFSNMPQFAQDFKCPLGSPMNPPNKCTVW